MAVPELEIRTLIREGGFIMWPLFACSVLATIVLVERSIALFGARREGRRLAKTVLCMARGGDLAGALRICVRARSPLGEVLAAVIERASRPDQAAAALERARVSAVEDLRRGLWILGTIGAAAPFVGLFGTVVGILQSFRMIARTGEGGFATVAAGISEALVATGAGLLVAIVAYAAHNYFQVKVGSIATDWKIRGDELLEAVHVAEASK
jgi:biopolymer transport protein ExbB